MVIRVVSFAGFLGGDGTGCGLRPFLESFCHSAGYEHEFHRWHEHPHPAPSDVLADDGHSFGACEAIKEAEALAPRMVDLLLAWDPVHQPFDGLPPGPFIVPANVRRAVCWYRGTHADVDAWNRAIGDWNASHPPSQHRDHVPPKVIASEPFVVDPRVEVIVRPDIDHSGWFHDPAVKEKAISEIVLAVAAAKARIGV